MKLRLVNIELHKHDWSKIRDGNGPATMIPDSFTRLLKSQSPQECESAYWQLENHAVIQGSVFEAAVYLVPSILAALSSPHRIAPVRYALLKLLFQILNGEVHSEEQERGLFDLKDQCESSARCGLWLLYRQLLTDNSNIVKDILLLIENDPVRIRFLERFPV